MRYVSMRLSLLALAMLLPGAFVAGCGDDDGVGCPPPAALVLDRTAVRLDYWQGDAVEATRVTVSGAGNGCGVEVVSDRAWLDATLADGQHLVVRPRPSAATSGVHTGTVALNDPASGETLATLAVELHALMRAPNGAPRRVLVLGVDGLRADVLAPADTPNIDRLMARGAWSLTASTQLEAPTVSGPGWASILTGVDSDKHGIVSNQGFGEIFARPYRTFLKRAVDAGFATKLVVHWVGILGLIEREARQGVLFGDDENVARSAREELASGQPQLLFLHFDDADHTGHTSGFDLANPEYIRTVETIDAYAGQVVDGILARPEVADEEWLVVLTSDHGGSGTSHGALDAANRTVPLVFAGPSIRRGEIRDTFASHLDVYPSVLEFLGIPVEPGSGIDGRSRIGRPE